MYTRAYIFWDSNRIKAASKCTTKKGKTKENNSSNLFILRNYQQPNESVSEGGGESENLAIFTRSKIIESCECKIIHCRHIVESIQLDTT